MSTIHPQLIEKDNKTSALGLTEYITNIKDYYKPNWALYWMDFIGSSILGNGFIYLAVQSHSFSILQILYMFIAAVFLFRASVFIHEAMHTGKQIPNFELGYNIIFGFVHKVPLYSYKPHKFHHGIETYGTTNDPEYEMVKGTAPHFVIPIFSMLFMPLLLLIRFGFVPIFLPFIGEKGRNAVYKYASTIVMNFRFQRPLPNLEEKKEWYREDAACFLYNAVFFTLMVSGVWNWKVLFVWYGVMYIVFLYNFYRVMTSHTYATNFIQTNRKQQILDSGTVEGSWALSWLYPLGQRYHALHHLLPQIPYHNLAKLHRNMIAAVPQDHPYRETIASSYFAALKRLTR